MGVKPGWCDGHLATKTIDVTHEGSIHFVGPVLEVGRGVGVVETCKSRQGKQPKIITLKLLIQDANKHYAVYQFTVNRYATAVWQTKLK